MQKSVESQQRIGVTVPYAMVGIIAALLIQLGIFLTTWGMMREQVATLRRDLDKANSRLERIEGLLLDQR